MIGSVVGVYNGKTFNQIEIKPEMIGHYLAEFSISYKPMKHGRPGIGATHSSRKDSIENANPPPALDPPTLPTTLRAKVVHELHIIDVDDVESNNGSTDTPLVSPFLDSNEGDVLNELEEYGNAGKLCERKVFSTWMAFRGNTRDLGSFEEETDEIIDLHQILEDVLLTERGDGVAGIK
ncbi:40S ribosomal protein S15-4 [Tanacetum coccineum]